MRKTHREGGGGGSTDGERQTEVDRMIENTGENAKGITYKERGGERSEKIIWSYLR